MNDWRDVWSAKTIARINSQEVSSESYRHAVSAALAQWDQSTGDLSDRLPDHVSYMAPPSAIAVADEPIIHSPNLPIPGGSEVATQGATDREGMPVRPVPQKRSWLTGEGTWLRSNDEPAPTDRTWWQFGGEMVRSALELTPAMQFNEMVQQCNEYFDRPVYFNEMADALDGSTQNIMNVFSFGATDYVGATQTDTFQGWQWDWQRGLFTFSREMLISAATGGSGTMMRTSTGTARYAWGGVWIAGLGYDSYDMGQHPSQAYEDFRQGDIRGGLWHTGLAVVSAFGLRAGLKGSALGKAGSTVDETSALAKVADEAPKGGVGAVSDTVGIADSALPGTVGFWQRWSILRGAKRKFGATPNIKSGQLKDEFVPDTNTINLTGSRFGKHQRGTFFEEVQHAIDDALGLTPKPIPKPGTLENARFHQQVFGRMIENRIFKIITSEQRALMAGVYQLVLRLGGHKR